MTLPKSHLAPWDVNVVLADSPFLTDLGVRGIYLGEKGAEFELTPEARHLNAQGGLNGGVIAALLDAVCGIPVKVMTDDEDLVPCVTLSLSVNFMGSTKGKTVRAKGRVVGGGKGVAFCRGEIIDEDGTVVAIADGSFKRFLPRPKA